VADTIVAATPVALCPQRVGDFAVGPTFTAPFTGCPELAMSLNVLPSAPEGAEKVLSRDALAFLESRHRQFESRRQELLAARAERQKAFDRGETFDFLPSTKSIRGGAWKVAATPKDLQRRHVEITGPTERKMMINALNSGADIFMADFEDSLSPSWRNVVLGQQNCIESVRRTISLDTGEKKYRLNDKIAGLLLRPRGWHLPEKHVTIDGKPISGSLFDFGLYFFHNARELLDRGTGPYFYLPKTESHLESRLWNEVFVFAQDALKIPR